MCELESFGAICRCILNSRYRQGNPYLCELIQIWRLRLFLAVYCATYFEDLAVHLLCDPTLAVLLHRLCVATCFLYVGVSSQIVFNATVNHRQKLPLHLPDFGKFASVKKYSVFVKKLHLESCHAIPFLILIIVHEKLVVLCFKLGLMKDKGKFVLHTQIFCVALYIIS